jgi:hypothetical protein
MGEMSMFDYEAPKEKSSTDYSGTIIGAMLLPVLFFFFYLGKPELGFTVCIVLAMSMIAVRLRWGLRKHAWFCATILFILALHVPLFFVARWPDSNLPTIAYSLPFGVADFFIIWGAVGLAERIFSKSSSASEEE